MSTKFKNKFFIGICILSLASGQCFVRSEVAIKSGNVDGLQKTTLSKDFEEKLDKLQKNMNFVMSELKDLNILRQMVYLSHPNLLAQGKDKQTPKYNILEVKCADGRLPENCYQVNECQKHIYSIAIPSYSKEAFAVSCDLKTEDSGWTVIQRRQDGSVNFFRNWTEYVEGFGDLNGEFFIGLEKLHVLTTQGGAQELYIILEDFEGVKRYANYKTFRVDSKETDYKLTVGNYSGDAGDSFSKHSNHKFSTWDRDNDGSEKMCAVEFNGGWWYHSCYNSNLNGDYAMGIILSKSKGGVSWGDFRSVDYSLKYSQMMIRPLQD